MLNSTSSIYPSTDDVVYVVSVLSYALVLTITATISSGQGAIFTTVSNDNTTTVNEND